MVGEAIVAWDTWEDKIQQARRTVGDQLGYQPAVALDVPYGAVEIRLPGGRRLLRGCLRTGLWRLVEDEVALSEEMPLEQLLAELKPLAHG